MAVRPVYELTVYDDDDATPLFVVSTDPMATYPYLQVPDQFAEQEVEFAKGAASIGQINVRIVDVPQTPGDQTSGFITQLLPLNGLRVTMTEDIGDGAVLIMDGVVRGVTLLDTFVTYELEIRDIRERERKTRAFDRTDTPTILPRGVLNGYGNLIPATRPLRGGYLSLGSGYGRIVLNADQFALPEAVITDAMREALDSIAPLDTNPNIYIYDRWKLLWRAAASSDPYNVVTQVAHNHPSLPGGGGTPLVVEGEGQFGRAFRVMSVNNLVSGDTLPGNGDPIDIIIQYDGPVTKDWQLHIEGLTAGELLKKLYDGDYSNSAPRIRYDEDALLALTTPVRGRIAEPWDDLRAGAEKHIYPLALAAPTLDDTFRISPVTAELPPDGATLPALDNANCAPDGAGWSHPSQDALNVIEVEYIREYRVPPEQDSTLAESDRILERHVPIIRRIEASVDRLGEQKLELSPLFLRASGTPDGGPITGDVANEVGHKVAQKIAYLAADRWVLGGQYFRVRGMRSDPEVEGLRLGSWVTCGFSWMPDDLLQARGLSRLAQVVSRRNLNAAWVLLTLIDAGPANAPVTPPTLGTLSVDDDGVVTIPVDALGSGAEARIEFAAAPNGDPEPDATSGLWTHLIRVDSTGNVTTPPNPSNYDVWVRARGELAGRRPSAWTAADSITTPSTPRVENVRVVLSDSGVPTVSWTPNAYCEGVEIEWDTHGLAVAPSFSDSIELEATDGQYEIPQQVYVDNMLSVSVTPYPTWAGSAVSGTAGPAVVVAALGTFNPNILHANATTRSHTGNTTETALQTVEIPPLHQGGKNYAVRVAALFSTTGSNGAKDVAISYGGAGAFPGRAVTLSSGTRIQRIEITIQAVDHETIQISYQYPEIAGFPSATQSPITMTAPEDIVFWVDLANGADAAALNMSEVTWLGEVA